MIYLQNTTDIQDIYVPRQNQINVEKTGIDLSAYLTSGETIELINETVDEEIDARNLVNSAETKEIIESYNYITSGDAQEQINSSLSGYATEEWVENQGYLTEHQDLSAYSTTVQVEEMISAATEDFITSADAKTQIESYNYITASDLPDVSDFVTSADVKTQVEEYNYVNSGQVQTQIEESLSGVDLSNYYTSAQTDSAIQEATQDFVTSANVETQITDKHYVTSAQTKEQIESYNYITAADLPDVSEFITSGDAQEQINSSLSGYATEQWVENQGYLTEHQSLSGLVASAAYISSAKTIEFYNSNDTVLSTIDATAFIKDGMVDNVVISGSNLIISFNTDAGKEDIIIPLTDIFDPSNYYTKQDIDDKNYTTSAATKTQIESYNYITSADVKTQVEEYNYITANDIPTSNTAFTNDAGYITSAATEDFVTSAEVKTQIESYNYVNSGQVQTQIENSLSGVDLSNYYTSAETDTAISEATENFVTSGEVQTQIDNGHYFGSADGSRMLVSDVQVVNVNGEYELNVWNRNYDNSESTRGIAKFGNINGTSVINNNFSLPTSADVKTQIESYNYVNSGQVQTQIENSLSGVDLSNYYTSAETDTAIQESVSGKQDTLISGTNIKTINNESILGSGNITIQGGGGSGGETVVELTKAQYEALTAYSQDTTYIITDADTIDITDYTTSAITAELSGTVSALTETVSTKADKANVSANSNYYFPAWNNQGIITGTTGSRMYQRNININGTNQSIVRTTNSDISAVYAPSSAGSAGQLVTSNGSGAPVWTSFKFWYGTQNDYNAITTKDSTCIYFITD